MKNAKIVEKLELLSPLYYAAPWDNTGLQVGDKDREVESVYIALDLTDKVIEEAVKLGAQMIITHHPMIFEPLKQIIEEDFIGRRVIKLIQNNIVYYAMHTNFDVSTMADRAAAMINLQNGKVLGVTYEDEGQIKGFGKYGTVCEEMTLEQYSLYIKKCFTLEHIKVFGTPSDRIKCVAIIPGSGKSFIKEAVNKQVDVLITGDIDHHEGMDANAQGLAVIDAGHMGIEKIFVPYIKEYLTKEIKELKIYTEQSTCPYHIF